MKIRNQKFGSIFILVAILNSISIKKKKNSTLWRTAQNQRETMALPRNSLDAIAHVERVTTDWFASNETYSMEPLCCVLWLWLCCAVLCSVVLYCVVLWYGDVCWCRFSVAIVVAVAVADVRYALHIWIRCALGPNTMCEWWSERVNEWARRREQKTQLECIDAFAIASQIKRALALARKSAQLRRAKKKTTTQI